MSDEIPISFSDMSKSDFFVKSKEELHYVDRRFHIPARARSVSEAIRKADGEWLEGGETMTMLRRLEDIENFLWDNRSEIKDNFGYSGLYRFSGLLGVENISTKPESSSEKSLGKGKICKSDYICCYRGEA